MFLFLSDGNLLLFFQLALIRFSFGSFLLGDPLCLLPGSHLLFFLLPGGFHERILLVCFPLALLSLGYDSFLLESKVVVALIPGHDLLCFLLKTLVFSLHFDLFSTDTCHRVLRFLVEALGQLCRAFLDIRWHLSALGTSNSGGGLLA